MAGWPWLIRGRPMANDTDVLTSNDCDVPSSCRNSEINSLVSLNMSFDAQDVASLRSAAVCTEKLDSHIANGCVKLREREGALECQAGVDTVVCGRHTASAGDDEANAEFVDSQHSTANGLSLSPVNKYTDSQLTDGTLVHSQDATESCLNCSTAACKQTSEFSRETLLVETAQEHEESETQAEASYSSSCEQPTLASDLSNLSIADKDSGSLTVPSDDSVAAQSDAEHPKIRYIVYESEQQMEAIMQLITRDLSEPYSIYTYRYFIHNWPKLCFLVRILCTVCVIIVLVTLLWTVINNIFVVIILGLCLLCHTLKIFVYLLTKLNKTKMTFFDKYQPQLDLIL